MMFQCFSKQCYFILLHSVYINLFFINGTTPLLTTHTPYLLHIKKLLMLLFQKLYYYYQVSNRKPIKLNSMIFVDSTVCCRLPSDCDNNDKNDDDNNDNDDDNNDN